MRHTAVGLNFIDTYHRRGIYPVDLPTGLGLEAAGVIEAIGEGVTDWKVGDRVAPLDRSAALMRRPATSRRHASS